MNADAFDREYDALILQRLFRLEKFRGIKPDLLRTVALLDELGHPERAYPALHVAGTNGKGSICAYASRLLRTTGLRIGMYTSPHLVDVRERMQVNGAPISREDLYRLTARMWPRIEREEASFFEATTAIAFEWFREQRVDALVCEVGMGGTWDSTVTCEPQVCALGHIAMDHVERLGPTLEDIARNKAGIFKLGVPVVTGPQDSRVQRVLDAHAADVGCTIEHLAPIDAYAPGIALPLEGEHQRINAAVAWRASEQMRLARPLGDGLARREALLRTFWPGRLQSYVWRDVGRAPIAMLFDVGHNPDGIATLVEYLRARHRDERLQFVYGAIDTKDARGMLAQIEPLASGIALVRADSPHAIAPDVLATMVTREGLDLTMHEQGNAALEAIAERVGEYERVVICGSFYVVGAAMRELHVPTFEPA